VESSPVRPYLNRSFFSPSKIVGLLLVITGIIFLYNPNDLRLKVGASMILLGLLCLLFFNISEKSVSKTITGYKLTLILVLLIFIGFIITYSFEADLFFVAVILGILIVNELLSEFAGPLLKRRLTILSYFLILIFAIIIIQKIINNINIK